MLWRVVESGKWKLESGNRVSIFSGANGKVCWKHDRPWMIRETLFCPVDQIVLTKKNKENMQIIRWPLFFMAEKAT